jgi:hypothetical protein
MTIEDIRSEIQITSEVIADSAINYAIGKIDNDDINLVCAEVLRMVLRKHQGLVERRIGKYWEVINPKNIQVAINNYMNKAAASVFDDNFEYDDAFFTRNGL